MPVFRVTLDESAPVDQIEVRGQVVSKDGGEVVCTVPEMAQFKAACCDSDLRRVEDDDGQKSHVVVPHADGRRARKWKGRTLEQHGEFRPEELPIAWWRLRDLVTVEKLSQSDPRPEGGEE